MKNLKVYNKIFSLILVGTIFCGSLTGCGVKAKEAENQDNVESKETTASENANILEVETILMKDGSYVTFPGKISGDRKSIFTEIVLPNEQAILSTGHNLINVEKKADGVTAEDFIKALYNDEEINQLKDFDGDRPYEELPKIQGIYFHDGKYIIIDLESIISNIRKSSVCFAELPDGQLMDLEFDKLITIRTKKDGYTAEDILKSMFGEDVEYTYLNSESKEKTKALK